MTARPKKSPQHHDRSIKATVGKWAQMLYKAVESKIVGSNETGEGGAKKVPISAKQYVEYRRYLRGYGRRNFFGWATRDSASGQSAREQIEAAIAKRERKAIDVHGMREGYMARVVRGAGM